MAILTRETTAVGVTNKNAPLSNAELDNNFVELQQNKAENSTQVIAGTGLTGGGDLTTNRTLSLGTSGVTAGTYGSASEVPVLTVDTYGRITLASTTSVAGVSSFTWTSATANLNISTADGGSFDAAIDLASFDTGDLSEGTNLYYTDSRARGAVSASGDLSYTPATGVFSVTTYKSTDFSTDFAAKSTTDLSEGTNLYFTTGRIDSHLSGGTGINYAAGTISLANTTVTAGSYGSASQVPVLAIDAQGRITSASTVSVAGVSSFSWDSPTATLTIATADGGSFPATIDIASFDTGDLSEGTNLYYTDARARSAISVTDSGGDGSLSYSAATGVITYTGPSASEVRAHFSGGTGVSITNGVVSIGQPVATTDNVEFVNLVLSGNLTVNGTTTTVNAQTLAISDNMIYLNEGNGTVNVDLGFAGGYNDGTYAHAGFFRDASDGVWKVFDSYTPEPDLAIDIDTTHASFALADMQASSFIGPLTGNATSADKWSTARTISLTGDVTGSVTGVDGSGNISIATTVAANSVALGTDTTGSYVQQGATSGNGISGSVNSEAGTFTVTSNATNANTASTIVFRDASGNFSAGTITAALSGNASTASKWQTARSISLTGDVTGSVTGVDGSGNISIATTVAANSIALGTDTTGAYVADVVAGNAITLSETANNAEGNVVTVNHADTSTQASVDNANGTVIQDITLDTYGHITGVGSVDLDGRYYTETEADSRFVNVTGDTMTGNLTIDAGTSSSLDIISDDAGQSVLNLYGGTQGTGRVYVGQSTTHGGGIEYNGDNSPSTTGAGSDYVTLWRRNAGVDSWTARNLYSNNNWEFRGNLYANTNQRVFADDYHPNADTWTTPRTHTVTLTGDVTGTAGVSVDGSGNWTNTIATTIAANSVALGTDTTGNYVAGNTAGSYILVSGTAGEGWSPTIAVDATSANTASKVVARDASGNFSAGTITANLTGNASTASKWSSAKTHTVTLVGDVSGSAGVSVDGSAAWTNTITTVVADNSHNHTSLTGVTSIGFAAEASDSASISTTVSGSNTYFDFNLTDDLAQSDQWRWRFTPSGGTVFDAMILNPVSAGNANLTVSGTVTADSYTGNLVNTLTMGTSGNGLSGSATYNNSAASTFTVTSNATSANTASTIVFRDASGNFSAGAVSLAGKLTADSAEFTGLGTNGDPGADDLYVGGYGIQGSRAAAPIYVHNHGAGGVRITDNGTLGSATGLLVKADSTTCNGLFTATQKSFTIDHPTREGYKLRYGSLEGPENGVYVRGKLTGSNVIELPEYWTELVDADTITVQLTPNGAFQKLYVKEIADNKVVIGNGSWFSNKTDCFYVVYGERKDVDKLTVEFEA